MRRAEHEVKERKEILNIMDRCDSLHLALMDGDYPYVIPMNFGYVDDGEKLVIYFHGAPEGKKLDLIAKDPHAAFSMSCAHDLVPGKFPCATTFKYESVCGRGLIHMVEGEEKMQALSIIMAQYDKEKTHTFQEKHARAVAIFRMDVEGFTGKSRQTK